MAEDMINGGSEEEENESNENQSDDDFGLPDLEFDDLQELDMSGDDSAPSADESPAEAADDFDMSLIEEVPSDLSDLGSGLLEGDLDPPASTGLEEGIDEVEDVLDSAQLISDRLGDEQEDTPSDDLASSGFNYDDLMSTDSGSSEDPFAETSSVDETTPSSDLFADVDSPDDLAALGFADEEGSSSEEAIDSTESLFGADDTTLGADDSDSIFGSDSLALETEEKVDFEAADDGALPPNYKSYTYEESSGGFTKVIVIGIVALAIVAAGLLWLNNMGGDDEKIAKSEKKEVKAEKPKPKPVAKKKTPAESSAKTESTATAAKPKATKPKADKPKPKAKPQPAAVTVSQADPGEIIRVASRTSKSYVIVGSFIDEDMAMDYATELSDSGKGVKIIEPYGKSKRYRVSVADYPTYGDAASQLDSYKTDFGEDVWALKY